MPLSTRLLPKLFFRLHTFITFTKAPFHQLDQHGDHKYDHNVNHRHDQIRHHEFIVVGSHSVERNIKIHCANKTYNGSFLDQRDKFVSEGGKNIFNRLRDHDLHHCCAVTEADGTAALHLAGINGKDSGTHDFRNIGAGIHTEHNGGNRYRIHM